MKTPACFKKLRFDTRLPQLRVLMVGLAAISLPAAGQELPSDDDCTLFSSAALISMAGDEVSAPVPGQDVLVCGTTIRSVGATGTLTVPDAPNRIDATGKVLMPGLVDGHVHLFSPLDLELDLVWGVTTVRNLFGNPMSLTLRDRLAKGEMWGPRMYTAGPIVDGEPAVWPGSEAVATAEQAKAVVAKQIEAGYDLVKVYSRLEPEPFFAAVDAARESGVLVGGHVPNSVPLEDAATSGMNFIEHLSGFLPALQRDDAPTVTMSKEELDKLSSYERTALYVEGFDSGKLEKISSLMVENEVWNIPTFVVIDRITASAEQKQEWLENHLAMRTVSKGTIAFWTPKNDFRLKDVPADQLEARNRSAQLHFPIVKALHDAGAELMLGTDTPNPFVFPGYSVHEELARFVKAGLSPWQALRTATVQPARFLGKETTFGKIASGLDADLLLLDADPLADIGNTEKIAGVMTRGRFIDRAGLDAKEGAVAKAFGND